MRRQQKTFQVEDSEDLDLNLGLEPETIASDAESLADELDLSDLEEIIDSEPDEAAEDKPDAPGSDFGLKDDQENQVTDAAATAEDDDELDFSDLEKMLESGETPEASTEGDDVDELELQFDIDEPVAGIIG